MCFDATTSLAAFISGVLVSLSIMSFAIVKKDTMLALLAGGWIWVIFMQWWEYMIWMKWNVAMASNMAYVFNIMQIPFLYFLFILPSKVHMVNKIIATVIIFIYLLTMTYPNVSTTVAITNHLDYSWWSDQWRCCIYFIGLAAIFLLLVRPFYWSLACVITLFVLLGLSMLIYGKGQVPSLWCFFAVFFPLMALFLRWLLPK